MCSSLFFLEFQLSNLCFQLPNMGVRSLVLLRLIDLSTNHFDLLFNRRHTNPPVLLEQALFFKAVVETLFDATLSLFILDG